MKRHATLTALVLVANVALAQHYVQAPRYVPTKATFVVKDEIGQPVPDAEIDGGFRDLTNSGARDRFKGRTDTNGMLTAEGQTMLNVGGRINAVGHYETIVEVPLSAKQDTKNWNVEVPVVLKRIRNQIPMYIKTVNNPYVSAFESVGKYRLAQTSSYDMVRGAFLPPNGTGTVADLEFIWKMTIASADGDGLAVDYDTLCQVRMTNTVDGMCRGVPDGSSDGQLGSKFYSAYEAPSEGYLRAISIYDNVHKHKVDSNDDKHYLYYFRIRTQTNEMGQVTNAFYGAIHGQINGRFTYLLNPTPNDRNVECDRNRNLFDKPKPPKRDSGRPLMGW